MNIMMKTVLLLMILTIFGFGSTQIPAQNKPKPKDVIVVELTVGKGTNTQIIQVPISNTQRTAEKPLKPGWDKAGDGSLPPQFSYNLEAYPNEKNNSKVYFAAVVERCREEARKDFIVTKGQKTEFELSCEIKITAYYGTESKDKSFTLKSNEEQH